MTRVERLEEADWVEFRAIRLRSLLDSPDAFGSTYGEESSQMERPWRDRAAGRWQGAQAVVFAARDDDATMIGTATGAEHDAEPGVVFLYAMWVAPDARGTGVGRALVDAVGAWARERGCERLVLRVTASNEGAIRFYRTCGFVDTGERAPLREGSEIETMTFSKDVDPGRRDPLDTLPR